MYGKTNWIIFYTAAFLVFVNFFVSLTVLPQYTLDIGGTEFQSGLQNMLFFVTAVILRFYFGPLADKRGRKYPLLIGAFVFATAPGLFLLSHSFFVLLLARTYQAIGLATFLASGSSLVADLCPQGKTGSYLGLYRMLMPLALLTGPSMAIHLIGQAGYGLLFLVSMGIGILSFGLMILVKTPEVEHDTDAGKLSYAFALLGEGRVRLILAYSALVAFSYGAILTFALIHVSGSLELSNPGIFFVYFGLGGIVANLSSGFLSDRLGRRRVAWPMIMLLGIGNVLLLFISLNPVFLITGSLLTGIGVAGSLLVLIAWLIDVVDINIRTTVLSLQESTLDIGSACGPLLVGTISSVLGLAVSFAITGILVFVPGLVASIKTGKQVKQDQGRLSL